MPKSKQPKSSSVASADGALTLAQARALVQRPAAKSARRSALGAGGKAKATSLPEAMGAERMRQKVSRKDEEKRRISEYKATLTLLKKRGVKGLAAEPASAGRRRAPGAPAAASTAATGPLQIFAEGDSWFDYPAITFPPFGGGVIPRLEDRLGVPILNMAKAGDEVRFMLGVEQRQELTKRFTQGCPAGGTWDLLLFSGGGNDIVDNPMALWIRDFKAGASAASLIHQPRYQTALDMVRAGYEDLIAMRDKHSLSTHLVFHAYDFAIPDGRGICHLGPWLKPTFDVRGFPTAGSIRFEVVKAMLKQFAIMMNSLTSSAKRVTFINTQGTLTPQTSSWHNELHPSKAGFNAMADVFHAKLKALFPSRVL